MLLISRLKVLLLLLNWSKWGRIVSVHLLLISSSWNLIRHEIPIVLIQMHLLWPILLLLLGLEVLGGVHVRFWWNSLLYMLLRRSSLLRCERIGGVSPVTPIVAPAIVVVIVRKCCRG